MENTRFLSQASGTFTVFQDLCRMSTVQNAHKTHLLKHFGEISVPVDLGNVV